MVVKKPTSSGGYGMLMGHAASEAEIEEYKNQIIKEPRATLSRSQPSACRQRHVICRAN
jgi:uncharacterized circularly permuted ATP-grasp superfamily protein